MQHNKKYHQQNKQYQQPARVAQASSSSQTGVVELTSNLSMVTLGKQTYYQYPFSLNPATENDRKIAKIIQNMKLLQNTVYVISGNNIFTRKPLSQGSIIFSKESFAKGTVPPEETVVFAGISYRIVISAPIAITSQNVTPAYLQLCHIVQKTALAKDLKYTKFGRNYFDAKKGIVNGNIQFLPGIVSSLYSCAKGVLLNTDVIYKAVSTKTILDVITEPSSSRELAESSIIRSTALSNYGNHRTVVMDGIAWDKTPNDVFIDSNGKTVSFMKYFSEQYNINGIKANQPLLFSKRKDGTINYYIPQLMSPTDIKVTQKLKEYPSQRFNRIMDSVKTFTSNNNVLKRMSEWGFENISLKMVETNGRVLDNETIQFKGETVTSNSWNLKGRKAVAPITLKNVLWLVPKNFRNSSRVIQFVEEAIKELGCIIQKSSLKEAYLNQYIATIKNSAKSNFDIIFVILPFGVESKFYDDVKIEIQNIGVISQCIKAETTNRIDHSISGNIACEACFKKGATIWTLNFDDYKDTMVVGLDVYHSGEKKVRTKPSVVGFVSTLDNNFMQTYSSTIHQEGGRELVSSEDMENQFSKALEHYKTRNQKYPSKVIVFRDGVGEGQLAAVENTEVGAMKSVLEKLRINNTTTLSVMITLKRIHTKFFITSDKSNPPPGTIIDQDVVSKDRLEFYLISHKPISGAVIPVKYQCLFSNDPTYVNNRQEYKKWIQQFAFKLSHCYVNKLSSIKVPSVAQYAHKIAEYVGAHVGKPFTKFETLPHYV